MQTQCVIFDLDGTLADIRHRLHHVRQTPPDWDAFFSECVNDRVNESVWDLWHMIQQANSWYGHLEHFICSGRSDAYRAETEKWLEDNRIYYNVLLMREEGDHRPDTVVKKEMLDNIRGQGYEVLFSVDDRPAVVQMWRANGVPCFAVDDSEWQKPQHHNTDDLEGKTLLTLMIGGSGSGKSTWLESNTFDNAVLSSDQFRHYICGDWTDQTKNEQVFAALHDVARTRLKHGIPTVIDATHLRRKDRLKAAELAPRGTKVRYIVMDRPLNDKICDKVGRVPEHVVRRHDQMFRSQIKDILSGDNLPNVEVWDRRENK